MLDLEDLQPGKVMSAAPLTVTQDEAIAFAKQFDPQSFTDESTLPQATKGKSSMPPWSESGDVQ